MRTDTRQTDTFQKFLKKLHESNKCIDESEGKNLEWYLSLLDRVPNSSLSENEIKRLESMEEHLLLCFACQNKMIEAET